MTTKTKRVVGGLVLGGLLAVGVGVGVSAVSQNSSSNAEQGELQADAHPPSLGADRGESVGLDPESGTGLGI